MPFGGLSGGRSDIAAPAYRTSILPPPGTALTGGVGSRVALSPDGRMLAFVAAGKDGQRIWLRRLDAAAATPLPGTELGTAPFWSPDSRSIAFVVGNTLKRTDVASGLPIAIAPTGGGFGGGTWSADGVILFSGSNGPLLRVPAAGGAPTPASKMEAGEAPNHANPWFLPDGRHFLFLGQRVPEPRTYVGVLDSFDRTLLPQVGTMARFANEHLLFIRGSSLMAQRFNASRMAMTGESVRLADSIATGGVAGRQATITVSDAGALAYQTGDASIWRTAWMDRSGKEVAAIAALPGNQVNFALSRDGRHLAFNAGNPSDVWTADLSRTVTSRFTFDPANDSDPIWSPDGQRVVFYSSRGGTFGLYEKSAGGAGEERKLVTAGFRSYPRDWSADGRFILYDANDPKTGNDVWVLDLGGNHQAVPLLHGPFAERNAQFSPDGRWIAYESDESGRFEIYVQSFPLSGAKWQVSPAGGTMPRWRLDGTELFYLANCGVMSVALRTSPAFTPGTPGQLFQLRLMAKDYGLGADRYSVSADGQRFLFNLRAQGQAAEITLLANWPALLKKN